MSVISSVATVEGFVIGSDGRMSATESGKVLTDHARKIFPVDKPGLALAYGLFGSSKIGEDAEHVVFDFETEMVRAVDRMDRTRNWWQYLSVLSTNIAEALNRARSGKMLDARLMEFGTYIVIGGFYGRFQKLGHIEVKHGSERSEALPHNYPSGFSFPFGSIRLLALLNEGDPRFSKYAQPPRQGLRSLKDGINRVRNDILAHYDPVAMEIDEASCRGIGGRLQIATITLRDGFKWVPGFEAEGEVA